MNNFGIIIEARTGSKRLPNKILKKVNKKSILDYLVKRVKTQKKTKNLAEIKKICMKIFHTYKKNQNNKKKIFLKNII